MSETAHPPTVEELEELVELVRRDPGSPAFVDLGEAYLALGRPRDAIELGARGLRASPTSIEGRMMVARAFAELHQWKQAQAELLKVVKTDRNHAAGFTLLGEVLMRRSDYERALPVLQHAQNLDPANPAVLALLKRARNGQALDPPPPIPSPQPPARAGRPPLPRSAPARRPAPAFDDDPTRVAGEQAGLIEASAGRDDATEQVAARFDGTEPGGFDGDTNQVTGQITGQITGQMTAEPAGGAAGDTGPTGSIRSRLPLQTGTGRSRAAGGEGGGAPAVRPRVLPAEKPKDAAQASLRQSAAVGETYLNNLLTAGMLDVPNVRAPREDWVLDSGRRWSRSAMRAMTVLFVLLVLGIGGGGGWYWYTNEQRDAAVARQLERADELVVTTRYDDLDEAKGAVREALELDRGNVFAFAKFAQVGGLQAFLYGTSPDEVERAMSSATQHLEPGDPGERELLVARTTLVLTRLPDIEQPVDRLAEIRGELDAWLDSQPDDHLVRWLQGEAILAGGDRTGAEAAFRAAEAEGTGPPVATIARANMLLDEGRHGEAMELYNRALEQAEDHPLALIGRSMARAESGDESAETMDDLNVRLSRDKGPRVSAYKKLALAYARYADEYYADFATNLDEAAALNLPEPRYRARIALGRALAGQLDEATDVRKSIKWYGADKPQPDPLVTIVDAELLLAAGLPESALERLGRSRGVWTRLLRGRAQFELGRYDEALEELEAGLEGASSEVEEQSAQQLALSAWAEAARYVSSKKRADRRAAERRLSKLGRFSKNKGSRVAHGVALLRRGDRDGARDRFEQSLADIDEAEPNPLLYRAHSELAAIALAEERIDDAAEHVAKALEHNGRYLPAHAIMGRVALARGNADNAVEPLARALAEPAAADVWTELAYAEAVATRTGAGDEDRELAREALVRAKEKGASAKDLARVVELVDESLAEELEVELDGKKR